MSIYQKIADVEAEMSKTQKNKATNHHLGLLKAKLSKLRAQLIEDGSSKGGGGGDGFDVSKTGDARMGLVGFPSVGKSTLLNKLTGSFSEVAAYEFTTLTCVPGILCYKGAKIQILDLPGIIEGAKDGKGRGKQVIAVARTCSLILVVLDSTKSMQHKKILEREMEGFGIRLNRSPPNITYQKRDKGNITVTSTVPLENVDEELIRSICHEYKVYHASFAIRCNATVDDIIDVIQGNRIYIPCIYILNKIDQITLPELDILSQIPHSVPISANLEWNLSGLLEGIWDHLKLIRIYTKPRGQIPDYNAPVILRQGSTKVEDFCLRIHKGLLNQFKYAMVWGSSVKHHPQKVGKDHVLADQDVVQIVKK